MAADYLIASLQPLVFDGPAPYTWDRFLSICRDQLSDGQVAAIAWLAAPADAPAPPSAVLAAWRDLDGQLRNAVATERARALDRDASAYRRPVAGCSLYWAGRVAAAFQEKYPARRDELLDRIRWDAAGELTPPTAPLSAEAAFTYAIRLRIVLRRQTIAPAAGNAALDRLSAASRLAF